MLFDYLNRVCVEWLMYFVHKWYSVDAFFKEMTTRVCCTPMPMYVYKVIHSDEHKDTDCTDDYYRGLFLESSVLVSKHPDDRVEYRVTWNRNAKYRVVSTLSSPKQPTHEMFVGSGGLSTRPKILCAVLKDEEGTCNVVDRVLKYAGPKHDFFEQNGFRMRWMFMSDDLQEDTVLEVLLSNGKIHAFGVDDTVDFKTN